MSAPLTILPFTPDADSVASNSLSIDFFFFLEGGRKEKSNTGAYGSYLARAAWVASFLNWNSWSP